MNRSRLAILGEKRIPEPGTDTKAIFDHLARTLLPIPWHSAEGSAAYDRSEAFTISFRGLRWNRFSIEMSPGVVDGRTQVLFQSTARWSAPKRVPAAAESARDLPGLAA